MSKMSELEQTVNALKNAADVIKDVADWLTDTFSDDKTTPEAVTDPEEPTLALEDVRAVLAEKSRNGHTAGVRELLRKYGAAKLSEVDPKHYEALVKDAEVLEDAT